MFDGVVNRTECRGFLRFARFRRTDRRNLLRLYPDFIGFFTPLLAKRSSIDVAFWSSGREGFTFQLLRCRGFAIESAFFQGRFDLCGPFREFTDLRRRDVGEFEAVIFASETNFVA